MTEITRYLLFASKQAIRGISLDANQFDVTPPEAIQPIAARLSHYVAVDFDAEEDYIYYSDIKQSVIFRVHTNGTGKSMEQVCRFHREETDCDFN